MTNRTTNNVAFEYTDFNINIARLNQISKDQHYP